MKNDNKPISRKKTIASVFILIILTLVVFIVLFNFNDIGKTFELIGKVDGIEMAWAILCLALYIGIWPLSLCLIAKVNKVNCSVFDSYCIGISEHFFNGITPFSFGGQPIQVYLYTQKKVNASDSTGIIVANFIALLIGSNIYALISLVYYRQFSVNFNNSTSWMIVLGFAMNLLVLVFIILLATCGFIKRFFLKILLALCKIKFLGKYLAKLIPSFNHYCDNAQSAAKEIFSHKWTFVGAVVLRMISLLFYYAIPFFLLRALSADLAWQSLPFIILASSFAITTMVWVPTPGGTGGIEFAFTTIFTTFAAVTSEISVAGMVLWRGLTYYLLMLISLAFYLIYEVSVKKHKNKEEFDKEVLEKEV